MKTYLVTFRRTVVRYDTRTVSIYDDEVESEAEAIRFARTAIHAWPYADSNDTGWVKSDSEYIDSDPELADVEMVEVEDA